MKNYEQKTPPLPVSYLNKYMFRAFMFIFHVQVSPVGKSIITYVTYVVYALAVTGHRAVHSARK